MDIRSLSVSQSLTLPVWMENIHVLAKLLLCIYSFFLFVFFLLVNFCFFLTQFSTVLSRLSS